MINEERVKELYHMAGMTTIRARQTARWDNIICGIMSVRNW